ncbi:hypothetical protein [uncultured Duncaniella sp.]|uniref:hypothetical protein n=1 Tax=uncultured Duncaniella sp. TaxID=2768039 RepID=UPI00259C6D87|nr:hypothetical protein [uncultured Duncaniella sp.]
MKHKDNRPDNNAGKTKRKKLPPEALRSCTVTTKMTAAEVEKLVTRYDREPLGELSKSSESAPWERPLPKPMNKADFPNSITIIRSSGIYIPTLVDDKN